MEKSTLYDGYTLVFEDDFDGPELDREVWNVELHEPGWVNAEWQRYVDAPENIQVRDGKLLLRPVRRAREDGTAEITSGRISTWRKREFTCGLFEARLKVPRGKGYLPAFWLMAGEERFGPWPACGEIDIMEIMGQDTQKSYGTIHYGLPHTQDQGQIVLESGDFSEGFHDFVLLWEPGELRWYVDRRLFHRARTWFFADADGNRAPYPAPFDHEMYLILNLAVGGSWVGYPDGTTDFDNAAFEVDWVRVYQKTPTQKEVEPLCAD